MNTHAQTFLKPISAFLTKDSPLIYMTHVALGSIFLALVSQIAIPLPFTAIPLTLQTLAVFLLAMAQGKNKAALSVLTFLGQATIGLPVIAGGVANPLWMFGPTAGYLAGFVAAAYAIGFLMEKSSQKSWVWTLAAISMGELIILSFGTLWLSLSFGLETAFLIGFLPFLVNGCIKIVLATTLERPLEIVYKGLT